MVLQLVFCIYDNRKAVDKWTDAILQKEKLQIAKNHIYVSPIKFQDLLSTQLFVTDWLGMCSDSVKTICGGCYSNALVVCR